jgi:hypothetical protein
MVGRAKIPDVVMGIRPSRPGTEAELSLGVARPRRLTRVPVPLTVFSLALPFALTTGAYLYLLGDLGEFPARPAPRALPRLVERGLWEDIGEPANQDKVEPTWPWTPILDVVLFRGIRPPRRPGASAANRVSQLWLSSRPGTTMLGWHARRAALNVWLSRHSSASELTQSIATMSYFGRGAVGIDQAAQAYFGRQVETLTAGESALLIGLPLSPTRFSPECHPEAALERRNQVLWRWGKSGLLGGDEVTRDTAATLGVRPWPGARCPDAR